jgi:hypothetical protein
MLLGDFAVLGQQAAICPVLPVYRGASVSEFVTGVELSKGADVGTC